MIARRLGWGILGTGAIARTFARALPGSALGKLVAVGSRTAESARAFVQEFEGAEPCDEYERVIAHPQVDAVYIATPHPFHAEWCLAAAAAGKHLLCEKPLTMNLASTQQVVAAARGHRVCLLEAFMYRFHPQLDRLRELLARGTIGEVRAIRATFSFRAADDPQSRLLAPELGGGGILDVGGYPASFARWVAGAVIGRPFADPEEVKAVGHVGATGVDETSVAVLRFAGGLLAELACGVRLEQPQGASLFGTTGRLHVVSPWFGNPPEFILERPGKPPETLTCASAENLYLCEADAFARAVQAGQLELPEMSLDDTLGNARTLDRWRAELGLPTRELAAGED